MVKPELVDQIKSQLRLGAEKETIFGSLTTNGFEKQDIEESFAAATAEKEAVAESVMTEQTSPAEMTASPDVSSQLKAKELFKKCWELYKAHWKTFLGIILAPFILSTVSGLYITSGVDLQNVDPAALESLFSRTMIFLIPLMIVQLWGEAALIYAIKGVDENIGVVESYRRSWPKLGAFIWVSFLYFAVVFGGLALFAIPGIFFSFWFTFVYYIVIDEDLRGMDVLLKSREYVRGRGWQLVRLLLWLMLYIIVLTIVLGIASAIIGNIVAIILGIISMDALGRSTYKLDLSFLLTPLTIAYGYFLYLEFKREKGEFVFAPTSGKKIPYFVIAIIGVVITLLLTGMMSSVFNEMSGSGMLTNSKFV